VRFGAVAIVRLKGTFRHVSSTSFSIEQGGRARQTGWDRPPGLSLVASAQKIRHACVRTARGVASVRRRAAFPSSTKVSTTPLKSPIRRRPSLKFSHLSKG
jgi:hypothetical protein